MPSNGQHFDTNFTIFASKQNRRNHICSYKVQKAVELLNIFFQDSLGSKTTADYYGIFFFNSWTK